MAAFTALEGIELVPVVELEPGKFSTRERRRPSGSGHDVPDEWHRYWLDSLADSGVVGLSALHPSSWLVPTRQLTNSGILERILSVIVRAWGGPGAFSDPDGMPVLDGGVALCCGSEVLIEPTCCGDLGNLSEWRDAATYRQPDWKMVWVGHPWVSVRFDIGRLVFSEPHESAAPISRWSVNPEELGRVAAAAAAELGDLARRLRPVLEAFVEVVAPEVVARKLAGLTG